MGERNYIYLANDGIYLYSHWSTEDELRARLKNALIRGKERWNNKQYLNRIIFSELIKDDVESLTGYGLSSEMFDGQVVFNVDINKQKVDNMSFEEFIK